MTPHAAGVALLAGACALAGTAADRARRVRLRALESWCAAAETLAAELEYRAPPLPLLLETAARQAGGAAGAALTALGAELEKTGDWHAAVRLLPALLRDEELRPLGAALPLLGVYPAAQQAEALRQARGALLRAAEAMRAELGTRGRVSRAAGLSVGLMLACLLW